MRRTSLLHSATWARQLADQLKRDGQPVRRLLAEAGIAPRNLNAENARLPFDRIATFFELAAEATGDDCLGLRFGQTRDTRDAGLIGYVGLSSPTVCDALHNLDRYQRLFSDAWEIDAGLLEETGNLSWDFRSAITLRKRQVIEFGLAKVLRALRQMTGRDLVPEEVSFAHSRNEQLENFGRFFGCAVHFAAPMNSIRFKLSDIHLPVHSADDRLLAVLLEHCKLVLGRHEVAPPTLIERVERMIADRLTTETAGLEAVASELGMSKRTLTRKLAEHGTTFTALVDVIRKELALRYLRDRSLSLTEIAFFLGYTELSSFNHAFRRWTGTTPSKMRRAGAPD